MGDISALVGNCREAQACFRSAMDQFLSPRSPTLFLFLQLLWFLRTSLWLSSQMPPFGSSMNSHSRARDRSWEVIWGDWDTSSLPCHCPSHTSCL